MIWPLWHENPIALSAEWFVWSMCCFYMAYRLCRRPKPTELVEKVQWQDFQQIHTGPDCLCLACNERRAEIARDNTSSPPSGWNSRGDYKGTYTEYVKEHEGDVDI